MTNSISRKLHKLYEQIHSVDPDPSNDDRVWVVNLFILEKTSNRKVTKNDLIIANRLWRKYR